MKITPIAPVVPESPSTPQVARLGTQLTQAQQSARDKAIAALLGGGESPMGNAQQTPVQDPSNVSMEESTNLNSSEPSSLQADTNVDPAASEAPVESKEAATQPEKEEPLSSQYAVLARKEKALRAKETAFKQREAALNAKEAELSSKPATSSIDTSKYISIDDLKRNAFSKLQELGISYDDLSTQAIQAQSPEYQAMRQIREELQEELRKVREEQANSRKSIEDQQTQSYQQALNQIKSEVNNLVINDPSFETIKETGSVSDVVDLIERTFKEDGTLLTVQEAAQAVEEYLIEEALRLANLKKVQAKLKPAASAVKPAEPLPKPNQQSSAPKPVTLTNSMGSTRQLSARERAILAAKGELK